MLKLQEKISILSDIEVSIVVSVFTLMVGLLGLANQLVKAKLFGTGLAMDSYLAVVAMPVVLMGLIPTMIVSVVVPSLMNFKGDSVLGKQLRSTLLVLTVCGSVLIACIGLFASEIFVRVLLPSGPSSMLNNVIWTSRMLWLATSLSLLASFLTATRYSQKEFILPILLTALPPLSMIVFASWLAPQIGTQSMALGLLFGTGIQVAVLLPIWLRQGYRTSFFIRHPEIKLIFRRLPSVALAQLPFSTPPIIAAFWAVKLAEGSLSYLGYSYSLTVFLSVTISSGLAVVAFPQMAEEIAAGEDVQALADHERRLRLIFFVAVPAAAFFIALQKPILQLAFQRGRFDEASVQGIAQVLPWYLLGMVAIACLNLLRNLYYSMGEYRKMGLLGVMVPLLNWGLAGVLINRLSYPGIGLAYGVSSWVYFVAAMAWVTGKRNGLWHRNLIQFGGKVVLTSFLASLVAHLLYSVLSAMPLLPRLILSVGLSFWVFAWISTNLTHIYEYDELRIHLRSFLFKKYRDIASRKKDEKMDEKSRKVSTP